MIRVICHTCGSQFDTDDRYAGQVAKCPNCNSQITIPAPAPPAPYAPAPAAGPPPVPGAAPAPGVPPPAGRPGKVTAIGIMTLIGGIEALIVSIIWFVTGFVSGIAAGIVTLGLGAILGCLMFVPALYSLVVAIVAVIKGIMILTAQPKQRSGPLVTAILQIVSIVSLDFINVILGVLVLVFAADPRVKAYFRP